MTERKQFNVYLPTELVRAVKLAALQAEQSLSLWVEEALRSAIEQEQDS